MAIASAQDREFLASRGFTVVGNTFANAILGHYISPVYVNPYNVAAAVIDGSPGSVIMWHAARSHTIAHDEITTVVVGVPCDTPTSCYVQAQLENWGRR